MPESRRKVYWLVALIAFTSVVAPTATHLTGSAQRKPPTARVLRQQDATKAGQQPTEKELDDAAAPIIDLTGPAGDPADEKRRQKNKSFDNALAESIEANPTSEEVNIVSESSIPDLPAEMSDLIVEGHVRDANAFLSEDKTGIYSEFTISVGDVIKAAAPLNKGDVVTAVRFGGRVRFPSGQIARYRVAGHGSPTKGARYLFFLKQQADGSYRLLTAYEMRGNKVYALDGPRTNPHGKGTSQFDKHNGKDAQEFRKEVSAAAQSGAK